LFSGSLDGPKKLTPYCPHDDVLRMLVIGGPPVRGGGGMPQRIMISSGWRGVADHQSGVVREDAWHRRRLPR
jgi:hypothetical protein